ncbi:guanylyl and adenylyl cyclase family member [Volvox carteri f. nagariensis]|uniref:Guanylyl and adenylyl cyclase family member n=1 Tax=Volvox carteri f. nagariensis TaxID=3068 RepID=D8U8Z0_VOLCA|nr:guanylyl and adenylyl cyclase family member [Volvox carteri f. nagariensis]EFJ43889.1 guanylyl and adenylyl cyclase family member [Volvox carteri f. nagariensis]|eukprot:XP_002955135.1 guanylyl and adenylyl cyclase family member [Volvox carteri f. nagariensis]
MFRRDVGKLATKHDAVAILFADIKGFTSSECEVEPEVVMSFLNELYNRFDTLLDVYGVYKVETIGDCYMVAGGLIRKDEEGFASVHGPGAVDPLHAVRVMSFAKLPNTGEPLKIRIGIHSGPVVSGVVGTRMPRFCLFGDTVNTASRMESTAEPGTIHVSEDCRQLLSKEMWRPTGGVEVSGEGEGGRGAERWLHPIQTRGFGVG